jgi:hypothetical protein
VLSASNRVKNKSLAVCLAYGPHICLAVVGPEYIHLGGGLVGWQMRTVCQPGREGSLLPHGKIKTWRPGLRSKINVANQL